MACVEECISERESRKFEGGLNTKVKLDIYKWFGKSVEFTKYLHGICDAGSRFLCLDQVHMVLMKKCVSTEGGKVRWNFPCVVLSVRM